MTYLAAGLLVVGAQTLSAQTATNSTPATATTHGAHHGMTAEQRKELMRIIGLSKEDLKDLSPTERRDKIKAASQKAMADFKAKKEAGTLTDKEKEDMELLAKSMGHAKKKAPASTN